MQRCAATMPVAGSSTSHAFAEQRQNSNYEVMQKMNSMLGNALNLNTLVDNETSAAATAAAAQNTGAPTPTPTPSAVSRFARDCLGDVCACVQGR